MALGLNCGDGQLMQRMGWQPSLQGLNATGKAAAAAGVVGLGHPCANATVKPPRNVMSSCTNLPTFPPHGVLDEHRVIRHPAVDLVGAGVLVEEGHLVEWVDGEQRCTRCAARTAQLGGALSSGLRAAAWLCLGMLEKRRKGAAPMEEEAAGLPKG
jgi:hypothetical protein